MYAIIRSTHHYRTPNGAGCCRECHRRRIAMLRTFALQTYRVLFQRWLHDAWRHHFKASDLSYTVHPSTFATGRGRTSLPHAFPRRSQRSLDQESPSLLGANATIRLLPLRRENYSTVHGLSKYEILLHEFLSEDVPLLCSLHHTYPPSPGAKEFWMQSEVLD